MNANISGIAQTALSVVFTLGGIASAIAAALLGVRMIVYAGLSSSYGVSQVLGSLITLALGLALMIAGPSLAGAIVTATPTSTALPGGAWGESVGQAVGLLMRIAAGVAAVGLSWNALQIIFGVALGHADVAPVGQRLLATALALILVLGSPTIVTTLSSALK
jgi:hypothetical protein